jgi:multidrug efflux pump subunit AcrA (membrane-fusion protein)
MELIKEEKRYWETVIRGTDRVSGEGDIIVPDVKEGEMVKKGRLVATYFDSDITSEDKAKLSEINSKINKLSSSVSDENVNSASSVDSEIQKDISSLKEAFSYRDMQKVKQIKQSIPDRFSGSIGVFLLYF